MFNGPFNVSGGWALPAYFNQANYFAFGLPRQQAVIGNSIESATNMNFAFHIFNDAPNTWSDASLATGNLVSSLWAQQGLYTNAGPTNGLYL